MNICRLSKKWFKMLNHTDVLGITFIVGPMTHGNVVIEELRVLGCIKGTRYPPSPPSSWDLEILLRLYQ